MALQPTRRARGANATATANYEATPGTVPAAGPWFSVPFVSHTLGEERPLIEDDTLGQGREMGDPTADVATNDGDIVVPVDVRNFGRWLKLLLGDPVTAEGQGDYVHTFTSGAAAIPSMSIEIGHPQVPSYSVHRGARANQLNIPIARGGNFNATVSLICIGETPDVAASVAGANPASLERIRFPAASGGLTKGGQPLASVKAASLTYSNNLEKVDTIQPDGRIEDSDVGMSQASGSVTLNFADRAMLDAATNGDPLDLTFGWKRGNFELLFRTPRVFVPKPKKPISGPNGIQIQFNWSASGKGGHCLTAMLKNDVAAY